MKCMYTSDSGYIFEYSEFISGVYTDVVVTCKHMKWLAFVEFEGHIFCYWHIYGNSMVIKSCSFWLF